MTFDEFLGRYEEALKKKPEEEREKFKAALKAALFNTYKELYNDNSENKEEK